MSRIVIVGGHGKVALYLARILADRADEVTSIFRTPDHTDDVSATGARPLVADIENLGTNALADLLGGHDAGVFSAGARGGRGAAPANGMGPCWGPAVSPWTRRPAGSPSAPTPPQRPKFRARTWRWWRPLR